MDGTAGFNVSNGSRTNSPQSSDSRLVMVYKEVKIQPNLGVKENAQGLGTVWPPWPGAPGPPDVKTAP